MEGAEVHEIEPWTEGRQTWRVLRAHDYNVDIAGGFDAAQLVYDYIEADGIRLPSKRRAYMRGSDRRPHLDPLMVSIDISKVRFS